DVHDTPFSATECEPGGAGIGVITHPAATATGAPSKETTTAAIRPRSPRATPARLNPDDLILRDPPPNNGRSLRGPTRPSVTQKESIPIPDPLARPPSRRRLAKLPHRGCVRQAT